MRSLRWTAFALLSAALSTPGWSNAQEPFFTVITTPLSIEGLTSDDLGNLYVGGRIGVPGQACPVWRIDIENPSLVVVGTVPAASNTAMCSPLGLTFDASGTALYVADSGSIYSFVPSAEVPPLADLFASGLPGANGLAFDPFGNLFVSDGGTTQGRVYKVTPAGVVSEAFRIQPMSSDVNVVDGVGGVGRDIRGLPAGTVTIGPNSRTAANTLASQAIVANGLAFDRRGTSLFVADTARGAIWRARFDAAGNLRSKLGCDTTFAPNTLCLDNVFVGHPALEGADGIALDSLNNIYVSANERNAVAVVSVQGGVKDLFRNEPDPVTRLRNTGPLEFPTSPVVAARRVCTSNLDGGRRDNSPATQGEVGGFEQDRGKISCTEPFLRAPAMPTR